MTACFFVSYPWSTPACLNRVVSSSLCALCFWVLLAAPTCVVRAQLAFELRGLLGYLISNRAQVWKSLFYFYKSYQSSPKGIVFSSTLSDWTEPPFCPLSSPEDYFKLSTCWLFLFLHFVPIEDHWCLRHTWWFVCQQARGLYLCP